MKTTNEIIAKENFIFGKTDNISDEKIEMHFHDMYEIYMLLSGELEYKIEDKIHKMQTGDIIITNPKEFHKPSYVDDFPTMRQYIRFRKEYLFNMNEYHLDLSACFENRGMGEFNHFNADIVKKNGIDVIFNNIADEIENSTIYSKLLIKNYLMILLCKLNTIFANASAHGSLKDMKNEKIGEILDYVNKNINNTITLDLLEKKMFLNKHYLCHIFKLKTGYAIMEYITYKRIMLAKNLLLDGVSPAMASKRSGFNDYSNFFKSFKNLVGVSPKDFIKNKDSLVYKGEEKSEMQ